MEKKKYLAVTYEGVNPQYTQEYGYGFWGCSTAASIIAGALAIGIVFTIIRLSRIEEKLSRLEEKIKG